MKKKLTIVFMGDSCIDAGRDRTRPTESFGNGYVAMVTAMLRQRLPRIDFTFVNSGVGGNTTPQCAERWDADVAAYDPDYVTLMIGVNDAYAYSVDVSPELYCAKEYKKNLDQMITHAFAKGAKKILFIAPYYLGHEDEDLSAFITAKLPPVLPAYRRIFKAAARKYGMPCIDPQQWFDKERQIMDGKLIAPDYVHPTAYGHAIMAQHIADALEKMIREG